MPMNRFHIRIPLIMQHPVEKTGWYIRPWLMPPTPNVVPRMLLFNVVAIPPFVVLGRLIEQQTEQPAFNPFATTKLHILIILMVGIAPLIETILLQLLAYEVTRKLTKRPWAPFVAAWTTFCLPHFTNSVGSGLAAGLVGGFALTTTYHVMRQKSVRAALGYTWLQHTIWNTCALLLILSDEVMSSC